MFEVQVLATTQGLRLSWQECPQETGAPDLPGRVFQERGGHCPPVLPSSPDLSFLGTEADPSCVLCEASGCSSRQFGALPTRPLVDAAPDTRLRPARAQLSWMELNPSGLSCRVLKLLPQRLVSSVFSGVVPLWESQLYSRKPEPDELPSCTYYLQIRIRWRMRHCALSHEGQLYQERAPARWPSLERRGFYWHLTPRQGQNVGFFVSSLSWRGGPIHPQPSPKGKTSLLTRVMCSSLL